MNFSIIPSDPDASSGSKSLLYGDCDASKHKSLYILNNPYSDYPDGLPSVIPPHSGSFTNSSTSVDSVSETTLFKSEPEFSSPDLLTPPSRKSGKENDSIEESLSKVGSKLNLGLVILIFYLLTCY